MPSTIEVKEKTVNNRDVISFSKEYSGETHEVFAPTEQATQVLMNILAITNDGKPEDRQLVLVRKGDIGGDIESVDGEMMKEKVVLNVLESLFDEHTARQALEAIGGGN